MHRKNSHTKIWICVILSLLLISGGFLIGLNYVSNESVYFVFLNIISGSYALLGFLTVIAARKHWKPMPVALILLNGILSLGHLYFLEYRVYYRLIFFLFILSIFYLIFYLVRFFFVQKRRLQNENMHLINPILPIAIVGGSFFGKMFLLLGQIETDMGELSLLFLLVSLVCAGIALIVAILVIKDREDKGEYCGKLMATFFTTFFLVFAFPSFTAEYTNYAFDVSEGNRQECVVVDKYTRTINKGRQSYHLVLNIDGKEKDVVFNKVVYSKYEVGEKIVLYYYNGCLGYSCYEYRLDFF